MNPLDRPTWRAIRLKVPKKCECGYLLEWVGVQEYQGQPQNGSLSICPTCFVIYTYNERDSTVEVAPQRSIPEKYLAIRDRMIAGRIRTERDRSRDPNHGPN